VLHLDIENAVSLEIVKENRRSYESSASNILPEDLFGLSYFLVAIKAPNFLASS
jgi:hypothetical protein